MRSVLASIPIRREIDRHINAKRTRCGAVPFIEAFGSLAYRRFYGLPEADGHGPRNVKGTRITVGDVLSYLASGMSEQQILTDFPQLTRDDIRACLAFAAERERRMVSVPVS